MAGLPGGSTLVARLKFLAMLGSLNTVTISVPKVLSSSKTSGTARFWEHQALLFAPSPLDIVLQSWYVNEIVLSNMVCF